MKILKIFDDEKEIYSGNLRVNTVYFKGKIYGELKTKSKDVVSFTIKLSNGKDPETGEWRKSTFANCTAFGRNAQILVSKYRDKDDIQLICKFYTKQLGLEIYKGFTVLEVIENFQNKEESGNNPDNKNVLKFEKLEDDYLPF